MATSISNGESGLSVRTKLNDIWHSLDLNEYNKDITDTAVDVFVYDTSKDSDGGAWRKRTQGTSWYNETLNTATRGSRKEFPAVAVIVLEANYLTIYDGDDPDLPMWMVFNCNNGNLDLLTNATSKAVTALNGIVNVATTGHLTPIDFISEEAGHYTNSGNKYYLGTLAQRNDAIGHGSYDGTVPIVNTSVNDVAMTVLPNAPIDAATGLPVPTIAVATNGGLSIIKDDGTVADPAGQTGYNNVDIMGSRCWFGTSGTSSTPVRFIDLETFQDGEFAPFSYTWPSISGTPHAFSNYTRSHTTVLPDGVAVKDDQNVLLQVFSGPETGYTSGNLTRLLTSTYNTGWMNGDIKLATLSDTDATNVTGSELVTNGTFDSDTSGWTAGNGATLAVVSNELRITSDGTASPWAYQNITTEVGKTYVISCTARRGTTPRPVRIDISGIPGAGETSSTTNVGISQTFVATSTTHIAEVYINGASASGETAFFDNISVRLAEEDRSVNGNGLQVFGTVTKNPVATGADLVGYRGNGYLFQPQAGGLNLTNDLSITWWQKHDGVAGIYEGWQIAENSTSGANAYNQVALSIMHQVSSSEYLIRGNGLSGFTTGSNTTTSGSWQCVCFTKVGTTMSVYLNGVLSVSATESNLTTPSNPYSLQLLRWQYGATVYTAANSDFALFRTSSTVPSPEQIKKIYEDEKVLFQENAQATLYGSSDAVTALAYDDTTNILSVGTSAGRSDFQGLRRVNNTTNAVGVAISASNGMIVEE